MSWLFFMDESGHDHRQCPYEVRGGVALHAEKLWGFVQSMRRLERYFTATAKGQYRATWVVPSPFFVSSEMTYVIQAADVCIYAINWGYRLTPRMDKPARQEIGDNFDQWLRKLQYKCTVEDKSEARHQVYGIVYVPEPYSSRK